MANFTDYARLHKTQKPPQENPSSGGDRPLPCYPPEINNVSGPLFIAESVFCKHSSVNSYTIYLS